ncbi:MAG: hypothetical protein ABSG46_20075, partial [Candidatus Binataceae bacterium]
VEASPLESLAMPQPLLRVKDAHALTWGAGVLEDRPTLASIILNCIATWSQTEITLGSLLAGILHAENGFAAVQMYLRLTSADARRSILDAAAHSMLNADSYKLFTLTMKAIKPVRERRNDFAHGIWGIAAEIPDALLWIAPDDKLAYEAAWQGAIPKHGKPGILAPFLQAHEAHREAIYVYRKSDLDADVARATDAALAAMYLTQTLNSAAGAQQSATRQLLLGVPLIQGVLQSENSDEGKSSPQPQPPPETQNATA